MSTFKYYKNGQWNTVNGAITGDTLPIGTITEYGGTTAPTNWLICDGSAVSRTTYASLFAVIGTAFGSGDGSTTFNLPDLRGRVPVGKSTDAEFDTLGETGGEKTHTLTVNEMPKHKHNALVGGGGSAYAGTFVTDGGNFYYIPTSETGGDQPHNNLQPYQVVNYIIKVYQSSGVVGNVTNTQSSSTTDAYSCSYVNNMSPHILYDDVSGTNENVTLNDSVANYEYIEVFAQRAFSGSYTIEGSAKIHKPNSKRISITMLGYHSSALADTMGIHTLQCNGSTLTKIGSVTVNIGNDGSVVITSMDATSLYVTRVIGYK